MRHTLVFITKYYPVPISAQINKPIRHPKISIHFCDKMRYRVVWEKPPGGGVATNPPSEDEG